MKTQTPTPAVPPPATQRPDNRGAAAGSTLGDGPPVESPGIEPRAGDAGASTAGHYGGGYGGLPRAPGEAGGHRSWHRDAAGATVDNAATPPAGTAASAPQAAEEKRTSTARD